MTGIRCRLAPAARAAKVARPRQRLFDGGSASAYRADLPVILSIPQRPRTLRAPQDRTHHRHHRPGRRALGAAAARQGLHRPRREAALLVVQHGTRRRPLRRPARACDALLHALRRHDGRHQPHPPRPGAQAGRDLQSRRPEPRAGELRDAGVHGQRRRARHAAAAGGDPHPRHQGQGALLPGVHLGALRQGAGDAAEAKRRRSIPARPTAPPSSMPTGSR